MKRLTSSASNVELAPALGERRYVVNNATVEKLGELLNQNPNGLLLFRDELSGFLGLMDRPGHENDRRELTFIPPRPVGD